MNLPAGGDASGITYFLDTGNLTLHYSGAPETIKSAVFTPSEKSAEERFQAANEGWNDWVKAHGGFKPSE